MRAFPLSLAPLMTGFVLSGCAAGPDYHPPALTAPSAFMSGAAMATRASPQMGDQTYWWTSFGDPLLTELVGTALTQNLDIAQAAARLSQAQAGLRAAGAAMLPSLTASGSAAAARQSLETPLGRFAGNAPGFDRDNALYDAGLSAAWEIDLFGGLRRGQEAARADYQASQAGAAATRLAVAAGTADTYLAIRGLQARIGIAEHQVETQRRLVEMVRLQYEKGVAAELQLRQAEGVLAQVEASLPVLRSGLDATMNALDILLGVQPGTYRSALSDVRPIPAAPAIVEMGTPQQLLRRRPDLIVAERRLAASNARIGVAVSEYYPKLSLSALLGGSTTSASNLFTGSATQAQGALGLRWRLFDFGRVDAQVAAARGVNAEALAAYRLAVMRASEDVENAFSALLNREEQAATLARGEAALSRAQAASLAAYRGGAVSLIEVLDADGRLLATRDARAQAQTEAARAAVASFRALGGGWEAPIPDRKSDPTP